MKNENDISVFLKRKTMLLEEPDSPWDWGQIDIKFGKKHDIKNQQILYRKMISMLTGSTSLASKCVFYRHEQSAKTGPLKLKFEALKMQR